MSRKERILKKYGKNRPIGILEDTNGNTIVYWLYDHLSFVYGLNDSVLSNYVK